MKAKTIPHLAKLVEDHGPTDIGYAAWKATKVERAKAQASDRSQMIDAETVWKQLGCDD